MLTAHRPSAPRTGGHSRTLSSNLPTVTVRRVVVRAAEESTTADVIASFAESEDLIDNAISAVAAVSEDIVDVINDAGPAISNAAAAYSASAASAASAAADSGLDPAIFLGGGGLLAAGAAAIVFAMQQGKDIVGSKEATPEGEEMSGPAPPPKQDAILVIGATGRIGARVVKKLLKAGRTVVAAARDGAAVEAALTAEDSGLQAGYQEDGNGILFFDTADIRDKDSLMRKDLWKGVTQVMLVVASKAGPQPGGGFGYFPGLSPADVEEKGIANLAEVAAKMMRKQNKVLYKNVVPMGNAEEVQVWDRMDDVIMGGNSSSIIEAAPDAGPKVARWRGDLIIEGGGFCGARTKVIPNCDLSSYDGITLKVKGDGSIFKLNIKTQEQLDQPESTYQTTFDTVDGQWHEVFLPWHNFVNVKRATSDPDGAPLDPSKVAKFGLVLSRFEFNKMTNPEYKPGPFELLIDGGIKAYKAPKPQLIMLSSAGVERNAIIADDAERRAKDVPIVQLNPGNILNAKYAAEIAVRESGYPYTVVRSTGLVDTAENGPFLLELDQGDRISGTLGRDELADLLCYVADSPEAVNKTFEARRCEALTDRGQAMTPEYFNRILLRVAQDRHRWRVGLQPFPKFWAAPAPFDLKPEERVAVAAKVKAVRDKIAASGMDVQVDRAPMTPPAQEEAGQEKEVVSAK